MPASAANGTRLPSNSVTSRRSLDEVYQLYQNSLYTFSTSEMFEEEPVLEAGAYAPGKLSAKAKQLTLDQLNYMRTLYGVNELVLYNDKIDNSQYGATGLEITGKLTHHFSDSDKALLADYMTQDQISLASDAIGAGIESRASGTYLWNGNCSSTNNVVASVKGYIDDTNNVSSGVGHRLNLLCLIGTDVTFGASLNRYSCMSIYGNAFEHNNKEAYYAWPAEGYFPRKSMADTALWSIELGSAYSVDEDAISIELVYDGQAYTGTLVELDDNDNGAHQTITYSIPSELRDLIKTSADIYTDGGQAPVEVIIKGIKNGSDDCYIDYTTTFFIDKPAPVIELESISLDQTSVTMDEGDTLQLSAHAHPDGAKLPQLTWSSSDEDIASVNASGLVTAVKEGTAVITAATGDGITASCTVEVLHTHVWELSGWIWKDDYTGADASLICQGCGTELTYPAEISSYVIQEAGCTEAGAIAHTASVFMEGTTYTDYQEETIPATGHDYGDPVWTWAADYSTAVAAFTCKNDASHVENVSAT
ncbi:MAG: Ig-like domain-containing protein, partial [Lachnospiraceae bacterium]|nr:Ig-like domain-containing protein [Lachnospiraceae bacterium]